MQELKQTYLVQRLRKPIVREGVLSSLGEALAFGGGLKNGGLSPDAMDLLRPIFSFDYMGSSEFEWGAVPESLSKIAKNYQSYCGYTIKIKETKVYVVCPTLLSEQVFKRINELSKSSKGLKEWTRFDDALNPRNEWDKDYIGWLELDNSFMFFTSEEAWNAVLLLFSIPRSEN